MAGVFVGEGEGLADTGDAFGEFGGRGGGWGGEEADRGGAGGGGSGGACGCRGGYFLGEVADHDGGVVTLAGQALARVLVGGCWFLVGWRFRPDARSDIINFPPIEVRSASGMSPPIFSSISTVIIIE